MVSKPANLINLLNSGKLKLHAPTETELATHLREGNNGLADAVLPGISDTGRFKNVYDAAHAFSMVAFKTLGYRPDDKQGHRQILFTALEHAVPATERDRGLFENANRTRNLLEYDGSFMLSAMEMGELIRATRNLQEEASLMYRQWRKGQAESPPGTD